MPNPNQTISRTLIATLGTLVALSAIAIDISLPAIPLIAADLGIAGADAQYVISAYLAGFGLAQLPIGLAADRIGRRPVLFCGLVLYLAASVGASFASSLPEVITARFVQGLGGAVGPVLARAIARDLAGGQEGARLQSLLISVLTIAPLMAPLVGSGLVTIWTWRAVFVATALIGGVVLVLAAAVVPETGQLRRHAHPLVHLGHGARAYFSRRSCWVGLGMLSLPMAGFTAVLTASSSVMADVFGVSPQQFGLLFSAWAVAFLASTLFNRRALTRRPPSSLLGFGTTLLSASGLLLALQLIAGDMGLAAFWGGIAVYILALGLLGPNATALILEDIPDYSGIAASISGTIQLGLGAATSLAVAWLYDGTTASLLAILTGAAAATLAWWWLLGRATWPDAARRQTP
ncbi:MAG: multidrug effflux MFS transporter [Pseudomonadota bacterium]